MKKVLIILLVAVLVIGAVLMFRKLSSGGNEISADTGTGEKSLRVSLYSYPTDLEPTNGYYGWGLVRMGIGETLIKFDPELNCVGWLAESWEQKDDETWVFHIRDGVTFHNGTQLTAQICMESIQRSMDMNTRAANIANIKSMSADGMDLTIVTNGKYAALVSYLAEPLFTIVDTSADMSNYANKPICTGPYMVESFKQSENTRVVKYENYWDGMPALDVIDFPYLQDADARAMALQAHDIDIGQALVNKDLAPFKNNSEYNILTRPSTKTIFCYMNSAGEFLSNRTLRKAVSYAVDRKLYAENFIGGEEASGPFSSTMDWGNEKLKTESYDPKMAMKVLDEGGFVDTDNDGYREMNGKKISLSLLVAGTSDITVFKPMSEAMQAQLKNIGIEVVINQVESYTEADAVKENYFDFMYKHVNAGCNNDPQNYLSLYFGTGGSNNFGNYSNKEFDTMLEKLEGTMDRDERIAQAEEMSQFLIDDTAGLFLGYPDYNLVSDSKVVNLTHYAVDWYCIDKDVSVK